MKALGWSASLDPWRFNDPTGVSHLVLPVGEKGTKTACGTRAPLSGQVEKKPHGHPCRRCAAYEVANALLR